jgi:hypothetical protein
MIEASFHRLSGTVMVNLSTLRPLALSSTVTLNVHGSVLFLMHWP